MFILIRLGSDSVEFKNIQAEEFYSEYLELKDRLLELQKHRLYYTKYNLANPLETSEEELEEKTERLKFVLEQLEFHGASMKSLILLSCGIDTE